MDKETALHIITSLILLYDTPLSPQRLNYIQMSLFEMKSCL